MPRQAGLYYLDMQQNSSHDNRQGNGQENFERFRLRVLSDLSLQKKLRGFEDKKEFIAAAIALAAANGFDFSGVEIEAEMRKNQQQWIERWM